MSVSLFFVIKELTDVEYISQGATYDEIPIQLKPLMATSANYEKINLYIDGVQVNVNRYKIYMDSTLTLMVPAEILTEMFDCAVNLYNDKNLIVERGNVVIDMTVSKNEIYINDNIKLMKTAPIIIGGEIYVPLEAIIKGFEYTYTWDMKTNQATLINDNPDKNNLPYKYSYVDARKLTTVKDQGAYGTCWAFAALTAVETTLLPETKMLFAVDHMSIANSFNLSQSEGGEYAMAMAYLMSWQGPVPEEMDKYGDGRTDKSLEEIVHVQEAQIIEAKDFNTIKEMVYKYGAVQSSIYMSMSYYGDSSKYYNGKTYSYCYRGENKPNHDIVIVGWDDNYSKDNFKGDIESDGAFICQNSWGSDFADNGIFYVSYYDTNIGMHNVVYTKVESTDNYDNIYQSDLCGWVGYLGCEKESATFANVYTAKGRESLQAVGFYAVGVDTQYKVYICQNFKDQNSLNGKLTEVASGKFNNAGYYTVKLDHVISLIKNQKYAIVVEITTPNHKKPVAVEYVSDDRTATVDLTDGEGYIKIGNTLWLNTESENKCNICLKAYTSDVRAEVVK